MSATPVDREVIRTELAAARATFHQLLDGLSPADWARRTRNPAWRVGHLLHHLAWSLEMVPREVTQARRGKGMYNLPGFLRNPLSAGYTRWGARRESLASVRRRYDAAYAAALETLDQVKDDEWRLGAPFWGEGFIDIEGLFRAQAHHLAEHGADISAALPAPGARVGQPHRAAPRV